MKTRGKSRGGGTYKSNNISIAKWPKVPKLVLNLCLDNSMFNKLSNFTMKPWSFWEKYSKMKGYTYKITHISAANSP